MYFFITKPFELIYNLNTPTRNILIFSVYQNKH